MNRHFVLMTLFVAISSSAEMEKYPAPLAEFSGEGLIKTDPDFITLMLSVHSECQENPKSAQESTDEVSTRIDKYFQSIKTEGDQHFKVLIDGGFSTPYSRFVRRDGRDYEICRNTFQKVTNVTLKMATREDFHQLFANIQDFVLKNFAQAPSLDDLESPRVYVTMSTPNPEITRAHRVKLEREALDLAVRDAKANFVAAIKSCEPHRWKIHSIKEGSSPEYSPQPRVRFYAKAAPMHDRVAEAAPVRFDQLEVTKSVTVSFKFSGELCYER